MKIENQKPAPGPDRPESVTRYVITMPAKDMPEGTRTLMSAAQGRNTFATPQEAQASLDSLLQNNRPALLKELELVDLMVQPCECYPDHFDPKGIWFDTPVSGASAATATSGLVPKEAVPPKEDVLAEFAPKNARTESRTIDSGDFHGEEGHLNIRVRDQDSVVTGFGKHNRIVVFGELDGSMVEAREDFKWGLPTATDEQRRKVMNGWHRMHPKGTRLDYVGSDEPYTTSYGTSVTHHYKVVKGKAPAAPKDGDAKP